MPKDDARVVIVTGGPVPPALERLVDAARDATGGRTARVAVEDEAPDALTERVLSADALLLAFPALLYGLPGTLKAWLDTWLGPLHAGRLVSRTARLRAGYVTVWTPDEPLAGELVHRQLRALCAHVGLPLVGRAGGYAPAGASEPADPAQVAVARRLGAALAGAEDGGGEDPGYVEGIERFNAGEFWEAHEAWEDLWLEADTPRRAYFQGLIQVAAAFHHHGNGNWGGMIALLEDGMAKLRGYRPRTLRLDVDGFLAQLEPWRRWAAARAGRPEPVVRRPESLPRIELQSGE